MAIKVEKRMASAGSGSMGNGKAVRALLAIVTVTVIAGTLRRSLRSLSPRALMRHRAHAVMRSMRHTTARTRDGCPTNSLLRPCPSHATCRSLAARLPQPSQAAAAASVSVPVPIGTPMIINGDGFTFSSRRCVNLPTMSASVRARVTVPWQQASMSGKAVCRAIRFFQAPACKGQTLDVFSSGQRRCVPSCPLPRPPLLHSAPHKVALSLSLSLSLASRSHCTVQFAALQSARREWLAAAPHLCFRLPLSPLPPFPLSPFPPFPLSARRCAADNMCQYARCPAGSDACTPPTDDSAAVTMVSLPQLSFPPPYLACFALSECFPVRMDPCAHLPSLSLLASAAEPSCVTTGCPASSECAKRTSGAGMECKCKAGYNAVGGTCVPAAKSGTSSVSSGTTTASSGTTTASTTTTPSSNASESSSNVAESSSDISDSSSDVSGPSNYVSDIPPSYVSDSSSNASESSNDVSESPIYTSEFPN
ncbi:unnamed protein product [Closterium sp. NIES-53]